MLERKSNLAFAHILAGVVDTAHREPASQQLALSVKALSGCSSWSAYLGVCCFGQVVDERRVCAPCVWHELTHYSSRMTPEMLDKLDRYRAEMVRRNISSGVVEQWIGAALPCATLTLDGDGPVVGRYGGPLLLPPVPQTPSFRSSPRSIVQISPKR